MLVSSSIDSYFKFFCVLGFSPWYTDYEGPERFHLHARISLFRTSSIIVAINHLIVITCTNPSQFPLAPANQPPPPSLILLGPCLHLRLRTERLDPQGIDILVALGVILLDVPEIDRLLHPGHVPVHVLHPPVQVWVSVADAAQHEFEMLLIDDVEADEGREEFDVEFGDLGEEIKGGILGLGKHFFEAVEGAEDGLGVLVVGNLGGGEAGFVDAAVEVGHHPGAYFVDLGL